MKKNGLVVTQTTREFFDRRAKGYSNKQPPTDILLLRVFYDHVINVNSKCVVTYIDFSASFDTVSHKFMDRTLAKADSSRKSHTIFKVKAIYAAASGIARVNDTDDKYVFSDTFNVGRGVIQADIISPVLFILALDTLVQQFDSV